MKSFTDLYDREIDAQLSEDSDCDDGTHGSGIWKSRFTNEINARKFDGPSHGLSHCMRGR